MSLITGQTTEEKIKQLEDGLKRTIENVEEKGKIKSKLRDMENVWNGNV